MRAFQNRSEAAGLIVDEQHLRGGGVDLQDFSDHAAGGNDSHLRLEAIFAALVQVDHARLLAASGADDLGGQSLDGISFAEAQEDLEAARLAGIFVEPHLFEAQAFNLRFQITIFLAHSAKVKIVVPDAVESSLGVDDEALDGGDGGDGPNPNEPSLLRVGAADLNGETEHLRYQHRGEHGEIAVSREHVFHDEPVASCQ